MTTRLSSADVETIAALDATAQAALVRDREVPAVLDDEADVWPSPTLGALSLPIGVMGVDPADPWKGNAEAGDVVSFPLVVANVSGNPRHVGAAALVP